MAKKLAEAYVEVKILNKLSAGLGAIRRQLTRSIGAMGRRISNMVTGLFTSMMRIVKRAALAIGASIAAIGVYAEVHGEGEEQGLREVSGGPVATPDVEGSTEVPMGGGNPQYSWMFLEGQPALCVTDTSGANSMSLPRPRSYLMASAPEAPPSPLLICVVARGRCVCALPL